MGSTRTTRGPGKMTTTSHRPAASPDVLITPSVMVMQIDLHEDRTDLDGPNRILYPALDGDVGYDIVSARAITVWPYRRSSLHKFRGRSGLLDWMITKLVGPQPGESFKSLSTGIHIELPPGYWAAILPRSSSNRMGLYVPFSVIDNGYRGELFPMVHNLSDQIVHIEKGQRIAQLVIFPMHVFDIIRSSVLSESHRGSHGFGSTGG